MEWRSLGRLGIGYLHGKQAQAQWHGAFLKGLSLGRLGIGLLTHTSTHKTRGSKGYSLTFTLRPRSSYTTLPHWSREDGHLDL